MMAARSNIHTDRGLQVGDIVDGKHRVLAKIGSGGMSVVWLAMNERANKQWAIKEVRKEGVDNYELVRQSLIAEVDYLKRLNHPNLPSIVDVIDTADSILIIMDYVEGVSLAQALRDYGTLPQEQVVAWAKQICSVLGYLHSQNPPIIYRDLKPSNIMLQPDGTIKIIDFGTAREFKEGRSDDTVPLGTQGYAAPEQFGSHQTDARTDIYNFGATVYHLVTGHSPSEPPYVIHPITQWDSTLSSGLESIISKCCRRNPDDRYQNMAELLYDLEHYHHLDNEFIVAQKRRWHIFLASVATTLVFAAAAAAFFIAGGMVANDSYASLEQRADAVYGSDPTAAADYLRQAARIDPINISAYRHYLELAQRDLVLEAAEHEAIVRMLNDTTAGTTNEAALVARNPSDYSELAYELGVTYYFTYGKNGNKGVAEPYLRTAAGSDVLSTQQRSLAEALLTIATNYKLFLEPPAAGIPGVVNRSDFTPREYWDTLVRISDNEFIDAINNNFVAICVYKQMVYEIADHCSLFANVTEQEVNAQLNKIETGLRNLRTATTNDEELAQISATLDAAAYASEAAAIAFNNNSFSQGNEQ